MAVEGAREGREELVAGDSAQKGAGGNGEDHSLVKRKSRAQLPGKAYTAHGEDRDARVEVDGGRVMEPHQVEQRLDDDVTAQPRHCTKRRRREDDQGVDEVVHVAPSGMTVPSRRRRAKGDDCGRYVGQ